ncbi:MAG: hypothetical protein MI748_13560, partial [Opitutales bacterium]|nr:hypothetical protein [Opitutales bacterium]
LPDHHRISEHYLLDRGNMIAQSTQNLLDFGFSLGHEATITAAQTDCLAGISVESNLAPSLIQMLTQSLSNLDIQLLHDVLTRLHFLAAFQFIIP